MKNSSIGMQQEHSGLYLLSADFVPNSRYLGLRQRLPHLGQLLPGDNGTPPPPATMMVHHRYTLQPSPWNGPLLCLPQVALRPKRRRRCMMSNRTFPTPLVSWWLLPQQQQRRESTNSTTTTSTSLCFLPDFTEHPKPKIHPAPVTPVSPNTTGGDDDDSSSSGGSDSGSSSSSDDITFVHDFIAGGVAGSASVIVGHPFDTIKVRLQTSNATVWTSIYEFGGVTSLFRGMTAPLGAAAIINAIVFGSYGFSSRWYDKFFQSTPLVPVATSGTNASDDVSVPTHDPWQKAFICGAFAGFVQCFVICPLEHIKCRLQIQVEPPLSKLAQSSTAVAAAAVDPTTVTTKPVRIPSPEYYNGPIDAVYKITTKHGIHRLYQGWFSTLFREVPAFGLYFCTYDYLKDVTNNILVQYWTDDTATVTTTASTKMTSHTWIASAIAGGLSGSLTWAIVYPVDLIKSHIQTSSLTTPHSQLRLFHVGQSIVRQHGFSYLFRGLNITLIRAFPVNGTIFPVYEFTLKQITIMGY